VTQYGTGPGLAVNTTSWRANDEGGTKAITVSSNTSWTIASDAPGWLTVSISSGGSGNTPVTLIATAIANNTTRTGTITVQAGSVIKTIEVTQFDKVSGYFNRSNSDGSISARASTEYNHPLATWAMELSYAAYNPVSFFSGFPGIPYLFMQDPYDVVTEDAEKALIDDGFHAEKFNYETPGSVAAHVIGHREIFIGDSSGVRGAPQNINNLTGGFYNESLGSDFWGISIGDDADNYYSPATDTFTTRDNNGSVSPSVVNRSSNNTRPLVVVDVRGSVTWWDWIMDFSTQFNLTSWLVSFETGKNMVLNTLLYGTCNTSNCDCGCVGCVKCEGYITFHELENPIILVTGHSQGAAIANLVAAELNKEMDKSDVYAYTFGTPYVQDDLLKPTEEKTTYNANDNIFNILNNNDAVTFVPFNVLFPPTHTWARFGRSFHITMPMDLDLLPGLITSWLGLAGHAMPNYLTWMQNLPGKLMKPSDDIDVIDMEAMSDENDALGLLPKILRVNCPVSVTVYDDSGNPIAFESQGNVAYPQLTDSDVVSWIAEDGAKMFFLPYGGESYDVHVKAYDYGTMTFSASTFGVEEIFGGKTFNNVNLNPNKEFLVELSDDVPASDAQLFVVQNYNQPNYQVVGEVTDLNPLLKSVTLDNTTVSFGTISTVTVVTDKTATKVQFIDRTNNSTLTFDNVTAGVSVVTNGDLKTWTIQRSFSYRGTRAFNVALKVGNDWLPATENVFALTVI